MKTAISKPKTTISTPLSSFLRNKISASLGYKSAAAQPIFVLGISGGPDSVALLFLLLEIGIKPTLAHVNYHLRGQDSNLDQQLVEKLAKKHSLKLEILSSHPKKLSGNLEENCRDIRYKFFEKVRTKSRAGAILVAHHRDDQIETFLMNLARGSSLRGFQAMQEWDPKRHLFRPLLTISKQDLLNYLEHNEIPYRTDKTNQDTSFSRNLIRQKIVPLFNEINSNFQTTLSSTIQNFSEILQNIEAQTQLWLEENYQSKKSQFPLSPFLKLAPALQKNIIRRLYQEIAGLHLTTATLQEILQTLAKNRAGLRKEFGPHHQLQITKSDSLRQVQIARK